MVTIQDIAKRMELSNATISNALTGKGRMRPEKRREILDVAAEMGYDFDRIRTNRSRRNIAVVVEQLNQRFCNEIVQGIILAALDTGYNVHIYDEQLLRGINAKPNPDIQWCHREFMRVYDQIIPNAEGLIYVSQYARDVSGILPKTPFPTVYAYCFVNSGESCVNFNDQQGAYTATRHLIERGRRRIAMLSGVINSLPMTRRFSGYQRALVEAGIDFDLSLVRICDWQEQKGYEQCCDLLKTTPDLDGIFCQSDAIALGAAHALQDCGKRIPQDISVIGYDNYEFTSFVRPALSTISPSYNDLGAKAFEQLIGEIEMHAPRHNTLLECNLIVRQSS